MCDSTLASRVLIRLLLILVVANGAAFAQENEVVITNNPGVITVSIKSPTVNQAVTDYTGVRILPGDTVTVRAGGCVQTGGTGQTWKDYVNPQGPNSDRLYHGLISIPYLSGSYRESSIVPGFVRIGDLVGKPFRVPDLKDDSNQAYYLRLGYEDDDYHDNGYGGHDEGTNDQCKNVGNAFLRITILRGVLNGNWLFKITSSVSGHTYTGSLRLIVTGNDVEGTIEGPEIGTSKVSGRYNQDPSSLEITRDTGLQTLQKYLLKGGSNKLTGTFHNEGKYPDEGTIEITRDLRES